jgi:hypothetical protein
MEAPLLSRRLAACVAGWREHLWARKGDVSDPGDMSLGASSRGLASVPRHPKSPKGLLQPL